MTTVTFKYRNHKGSTRVRTVKVHSLDFMVPPGAEYQPGWYLTGTDLDKNEVRSFALSHIVLEGTNMRSLLARIPL